MAVYNSNRFFKKSIQTTSAYLLVEVRIEGDLLHVLGLAKFHERFPSGVVGVEHLKIKLRVETHKKGDTHSRCVADFNMFSSITRCT